jgi:hypothetical protein
MGLWSFQDAKNLTRPIFDHAALWGNPLAVPTVSAITGIEILKPLAAPQKEAERWRPGWTPPQYLEACTLDLRDLPEGYRKHFGRDLQILATDAAACLALARCCVTIDREAQLATAWLRDVLRAASDITLQDVVNQLA